MNQQDTLSEKETEQFYRLKHTLYIFVNKKINAFPQCTVWEDVGLNSPEEIKVVRDYIFFQHREMIDEFIEQNPSNLSKAELDIIKSWKEAIVADKFILCKHAKEHTLFLGKGKVYGVKGLMDSFKDIFEGYSPLFIDFIILPFKDQLVHEGMFIPYRISIGGNMASSIKAEAEEFIQKEGIITSLTQREERKETSDDDLLRFYMKSESNRDKFWNKIDDLVIKSPKLLSIYNYEMGRINSRHIKSQIKIQGIQGNFAVLFSQVIASGKTKKELQQNIFLIVPKEKQGDIYTFEVK
jgi:hypothetical protein